MKGFKGTKDVAEALKDQVEAMELKGVTTYNMKKNEEGFYLVDTVGNNIYSVTVACFTTDDILKRRRENGMFKM